MGAPLMDHLCSRIAEHNAGEHRRASFGCAWCAGDAQLARMIEHLFGIEGVPCMSA
jgi:hypothetical protein